MAEASLSYPIIDVVLDAAGEPMIVFSAEGQFARREGSAWTDLGIHLAPNRAQLHRGILAPNGQVIVAGDTSWVLALTFPE